MATYRQLLSEKHFLKVRQRARALMRDGSDLIAIYYKDNLLIFKTRSGTDRNIIWTQKVEISDITMDAILNRRSFKDVETLIKNSNLKVFCNCPAFLYWGYKYIAWRKGYGLEKENRRPVVRNPHQQGYVCKHLYLVMQLYPFWSKALASKFIKYTEGKVLSDNSVRNLERVRKNRNERNNIPTPQSTRFSEEQVNNDSEEQNFEIEPVS